jgi:molybdopterin-guanine dinucleotide biosynthesis protein A
MIAGLVLAGGESRRMGSDKALIPIQGKPAFLYFAELLTPYCETVYVSCRTTQQLTLEDDPTIVGLFDRPAHAGRGPMSGILSYLSHSADNHSSENQSSENQSAVNQSTVNQSTDNQSADNQSADNQSSAHPDGLLVLGCDYRNMTEEVLSTLVAVGQSQHRICCYQNHLTQFIEPLVAYYPTETLKKLPAFAKENTSLRAFVQSNNPCILPTDVQTLNALRSFDH